MILNPDRYAASSVVNRSLSADATATEIVEPPGLTPVNLRKILDLRESPVTVSLIDCICSRAAALKQLLSIVHYCLWFPPTTCSFFSSLLVFDFGPKNTSNMGDELSHQNARVGNCEQLRAIPNFIISWMFCHFYLLICVFWRIAHQSPCE